MTEALRDFIPDLAHTTTAMRELLKKKNTYVWGPMQEKEFEDIRETLVNPANLACFNLKLPSFLITDASWYGLGFILYQV